MLNNQRFFSVFNNTTNSYKYYWWLSILKTLNNKNNSEIKLEELAIEMLVSIWYPINYFKISLGKQDQLSKYVLQIRKTYSLNDEITEKELKSFLIRHKGDKELGKILKNITRYVSYRFISPWFPSLVGKKDSEKNKIILNKQGDILINPPYQIDPYSNHIIINKNWKEWILSNVKMITSFTLYELFKYVESNNPNVPNISIKLFRPRVRKLSYPKTLWDNFIHIHNDCCSVFENVRLNKIESVSIDHFVPWSFLTHDELWNLHPMEKSNNSSKGNKLPHLEYLNRFCNIQYQFLQFLLSDYDKYTESYCVLLELGTNDLRGISKYKFSTVFTDKIKPKFQIAKNMGFDSDWCL